MKKPSPRTPPQKQDLRTAAEAFAQAVELWDKQVAFMSFRAALVRWCVRPSEQDLSPERRRDCEAERIAALDEEVGAGTLMACIASLKEIKTPVRLNQVAECEEILQQWKTEYTAAQQVRKSWLSSVCEASSGSEIRLAASLGGASQVPKRRGVKRKVVGATLLLGLGAGATVAASGTTPLIWPLFTKTASVFVMI